MSFTDKNLVVLRIVLEKGGKFLEEWRGLWRRNLYTTEGVWKSDANKNLSSVTTGLSS
jgi:hypothetical protein